jgi:hypothetical protein
MDARMEGAARTAERIALVRKRVVAIVMCIVMVFGYSRVLLCCNGRARQTRSDSQHQSAPAPRKRKLQSSTTLYVIRIAYRINIEHKINLIGPNTDNITKPYSSTFSGLK